MHSYRHIDEWLFSILLNVEKTEVSKLKEDDRLFDCGGVLDDDDLNDFDNLIVINK